MFRIVERWLRPTSLTESAAPPPGLLAFYWHFARQAKGLFVGLFAAGFLVALIDILIPVFIGKVVTLITDTKPDELFDKAWPMLAGMAAVLLLLRPAAITVQQLLMNQAIAANVSNRIRWQNHWHVVRQSWAFFQNDFAGRIANRVMQTGPAVRESLVSLLTAVWYILVYGTSALMLLASADPWLALPVALWFAGYIGDAALDRAAHARPLEDDVGSALDAHRAHRRQLHQHPDGEAVRARQGRRSLCARGDRSSQRPLPRTVAPQHAARPDADRAQRAADHLDRRFRHLALARRAYRRRRRGHGAADDHADRQRLRLGRLADHRHLRKYRRGAGRHADHRAPAHADRQRRTRRRLR